MGDEAERQSTIRYTPFEQRFISSSYQLQQKHPEWFGGLGRSWESKMTPWRMAGFVLVMLFGLAFYLWIPTTSSFMIVEFMTFGFFAHFLEIMIVQFNQRRRGFLFLALFMLFLSLFSYVFSWYFFDNDGPGRIVMMAITAIFWVPFYLLEAYNLIKAYQGSTKGPL